MQCMQPNFLLTGQVYPMLMSSVPHAWGTLERKSTLFKLIVNFLLKDVVFMFWYDIVYIELFYCVTDFELVWTWNKVAVVENAKKRRLYPTFPLLSKSFCFAWLSCNLIAPISSLVLTFKCNSLLHDHDVFRHYLYFSRKGLLRRQKGPRFQHITVHLWYGTWLRKTFPEFMRVNVF